MADFEAIGRTQTLRAVTNDIADLATTMRRQDEIKRRGDIMQENIETDIAIKKETLNQARQENKRKNTFVPLDQAGQAFDFPETKTYALQKAQAMGYVEEVGGVQGIRAGNAETFMRMMTNPENKFVGEIAQVRLNAIDSRLKQVNTALTEEKNDKKRAELMQTQKQLSSARLATLQGIDQLDKAKDLWGKFTPESIQKYFATGQQDRSVLVPVKTAAEIKADAKKTPTPEQALEDLQSIGKVKAELETIMEGGDVSDELKSKLAQFQINIGSSNKISAKAAKKYMRILDRRERYLEQFTPADVEKPETYSQTATNPETGEKVGWNGEEWVPIK